MDARLSIINAMLASVGTAALTEANDRHPYFIKANNTLVLVLEQLQSKGYWFNSSVRIMQPDVDGRIVLPTNAVHVDPIDPVKRYVMRGRYFWNLTTGTDIIGEAVECSIIENLPVEDLPPTARVFLRQACVYNYYLDESGMEPKLSSYARLLEIARAAFNSEHLKNSDVNFFTGTTATSLIRNGVGISSINRG